LGESYYQRGELDKAHEAMRQCSRFSGYLYLFFSLSLSLSLSLSYHNNNNNNHSWDDPLKIRLRVVSDQINVARRKGGANDDNDDDDDDDDDDDEVDEAEKAEMAALEKDD
jgi:hypothetical protein